MICKKWQAHSSSGWIRSQALSKQFQMRDQTRFLRTLCSQVLKTSNDGNCTTHCGNLLHWLTVILKKVLFMSSLNLLFGFIVVFSHLPMLHHCENPSSVILINFLLILESFCQVSPKTVSSAKQALVLQLHSHWLPLNLVQSVNLMRVYSFTSSTSLKKTLNMTGPGINSCGIPFITEFLLRVWPVSHNPVSLCTPKKLQNLCADETNLCCN